MGDRGVAGQREHAAGVAAADPVLIGEIEANRPTEVCRGDRHQSAGQVGIARTYGHAQITPAGDPPMVNVRECPKP